MSESSAPWAVWFPPDLDEQVAAEIGAAYWADDPHLAAALAWEAYAGTLEPTASVASVNTGAQSVTYSPAAASGPFGLAIARAQWHRSFLGDLGSVPLAAHPALGSDALGWAGRYDDLDGGCWWPAQGPPLAGGDIWRVVG